jgi:hypothetical protein
LVRKEGASLCSMGAKVVRTQASVRHAGGFLRPFILF